MSQRWTTAKKKVIHRKEKEKQQCNDIGAGGGVFRFIEGGVAATRVLESSENCLSTRLAWVYFSPNLFRVAYSGHDWPLISSADAPDQKRVRARRFEGSVQASRGPSSPTALCICDQLKIRTGLVEDLHSITNLKLLTCIDNDSSNITLFIPKVQRERRAEIRIVMKLGWRMIRAKNRLVGRISNPPSLADPARSSGPRFQASPLVPQ